ncbi:hypothetical protein [Pseudomonas sp. PMCC200344]|uniref:hypothetical protein n=1 Tax=Pseudomonas sp. PMCC200344 TaxID=3042028 RepID=UPI0024B3555C|nr:hypothetical protein [Pseudomonas sp. PMCC200344]
MITERETGSASSQGGEGLSRELSGSPEQIQELNSSIGDIPHADVHSDKVAHAVEPKQKTVKSRSIKKPSTTVATVHAKEFAMHKRSILTNKTPHIPGSKMRAKTLLDQPSPTETNLKRWRDVDEFTKLAAAATPLYWMADKKGWELKTFTLILSKKLNDRLDRADSTATQYIRDQLTRVIPEALGAGAEFLYGLEKAPGALADGSSRRRWHLHGLIIGPAGFSASGKTPLRKALQPLKGEADSDLMLQTPGTKIEQDPRHSAIRWCFYAAKNGLSVQVDPALAGAYNLPAGKQTFISTQLRREAERWYRGRVAGLTFPQLIQDAPAGLYALAADLPTTWAS